MHAETTLLRDVAVILAAAFPLLFLCRWLRIPEVLGYLITGVIIGPHAFALVRDTARVETIAELGVALILFFVGLHVPVRRLKALGRAAFLSGPLQMVATSLGIAAIGMLAGIPLRLGLFYGLLFSLGSTAVVLPILTTRDEMGSPFARRFLAVSIFQDFAVIPLMLLVPAFAPGVSGGAGLARVMLRVGLAIGGVVALILAAQIVVPRLFALVARLGSREAFTAAAVVLIIGTIAIAGRIGISAALGAFAAGVVVGDTDFIHQIEGVLRPFRDFLSALFFTSVGMLLDPSFAIAHPLPIALTVLAVVVVKIIAAYPAFLAAPSMKRTSIRAAFAVAPVGEFSFLLAEAAKDIGLLGGPEVQTVIAVAVITLAATPLLVEDGRRVAAMIHESAQVEEDGDVTHIGSLQQHIIIVGYGLNGQNVARVLTSTGIRHVVLEEDPDRVAAARTDGSRALLVDATDDNALLQARIDRATGVIIAISDADGTRRIVRVCRDLNPYVHIVVRTRYVSEVERLRALGADEVIPEEFETSLEIVTRTLKLLAIPQNVVANQLRLLRDEGYRLLRDPAMKATDGRRLAALFAGGTSQTFLILPGTYPEGRTLEELSAELDDVGAAALLRDGRALSPLPMKEPLQAGDTLLLVGAHADLTRAVARLEHTPPA